jgi:hypothetical protein
MHTTTTLHCAASSINSPAGRTITWQGPSRILRYDCAEGHGDGTCASHPADDHGEGKAIQLLRLFSTDFRVAQWLINVCSPTLGVPELRATRSSDANGCEASVRGTAINLVFASIEISRGARWWSCTMQGWPERFAVERDGALAAQFRGFQRSTEPCITDAGGG